MLLLPKLGISGVGSLSSSRITYGALHYLPPTEELIRRFCRYLSSLGASVKVMTKSVEGRDIYLIRVGEGRLKALVIAGIHGNEPAPISASLALTYVLAKKSPPNPYFDIKYLIKEVTTYVVTPLNPDGLSRYLSGNYWEVPNWSSSCEEGRVNANYVDLNRDWVLLTQPETLGAHRVIEELDPHLVIDLHEFHAKGGSPPKWGYETEGFMISLTDSPYGWVNDCVKSVSNELMIDVSKYLRTVFSGWVIKSRHFLGGTEGVESVVWAPPNYLGTHVSIEGRPKLLIETWGIGLGKYLYPDRVAIHVHACLEALTYLADHGGKFVRAKEEHVREDLSRYGLRGKYVISGEDTQLTRKVLKEHGIDVVSKGNELIIELPQYRGRNKLANILLNPDCEFNVELRRRLRGPYTLDRLINVEVRVKA